MNVHSASIKGLREQNEDKHDIILNGDKKNPEMCGVNFFAVYDGHGGKEVSKYLKDNLSKYFVAKDLVYPLKPAYINQIYDKIQEELKKNNHGYVAGSTALVAIHHKVGENDYLSVINTGDCRCIICRDNFAHNLSKDHKPHWPEEKHRIEKLGGKIAFDGYDWRIKDLSVSRAFGDIDATPYVTHRPDIFKFPLDKKHDKFIVLACDGVWDVLSDNDVVNFILLNCYDSTTKNRINIKVNIAEQLAQYALKKGSTDNVTIIVIFLK